MTVIRADMHRREKWIQCGDLRVAAPKGGDMEGAMCQALMEAGHPDCALHVYDERGMHCLIYRSIYATAARMVMAPKSDAIPLATYVALRQVQMGLWEQLHHRTKTSLIEREFVDDQANLTETATAEMITYEAVNGVPKITAEGTVIKAEPLSKIKKINLTEKQITAFTIAIKQPYKWITVPSRTVNFMINNGWVVVVDDAPKLTQDGKQVYDAYLSATLVKKAA